ncbi:MAG: restriction endonuclease subunit S [Candidatus Omnitrophota bacterium]
MKKTVKLKPYCAKIGSGITPRGGETVYIDSGVALIRSQNVYNGSFMQQGLAFVDNDIAQKMRGVTLEKNDILLNITGDSVARCCMVPEDFLPARVNQHVSIVRTNKEKLDSQFLMYYLISPIMQSRMLSLAGSGGTRKALTKEMIEDFEIPLIDLPRQQNVSSILFTYDNLIDTNRRRIQLLEEAARLLFREWFVYFRFPLRLRSGQAGYEVETQNLASVRIVDGMPVGWGREKLNKYVSFKRGVEPGSDNYLETQEIDTYPFYRVSDLVTRKPEIFVDELHTKGALLEKKDIVVSLDGSVGIVSMGLDGCYSTGIRKLVTKGKRINRSFLYYLMKSHYIQGIINAYAKGTTIQHAGESIKHMNPILPPQSLMDKFGEVVDPILNGILTLLDQNQKLAQARDLLLPRLMSGAIVP